MPPRAEEASHASNEPFAELPSPQSAPQDEGGGGGASSACSTRGLLSIRSLNIVLCLASLSLCASLSTWLAVTSGDNALEKTEAACDSGLLRTSEQAADSALQLANRVLETTAQTTIAYIAGTLDSSRQASGEWWARLRAVPAETLLTWDYVYSLRTAMWATMWTNRFRFTGMGLITVKGHLLTMQEDDVTVGNSDYHNIGTLMNNGSDFGSVTNRTVFSWAQPWDGALVGSKLPGETVQQPGGLQYMHTTDVTEAKCNCFRLYGPDPSLHPYWCGECTYTEFQAGLCTNRTRGWCPEPICLSKTLPEPMTTPGGLTHDTPFILGMCPRPMFGPFQLGVWSLSKVMGTNQIRWGPLAAIGPYIGLLSLSTFLHPSAVSNSSLYETFLGSPRSGMTFVGTDVRRVSRFLAEDLWGDEGMGQARVFVTMRSSQFMFPPRRQEGVLVGASHGLAAELTIGKSGVPQGKMVHINQSTDLVVHTAGQFIQSYRTDTAAGWDAVYEQTRSGTASPLDLNVTYANGTVEQFLLKLKRIEDNDGLDLWVGLTLDYEYVMGAIDRAAQAVNANITATRSHVQDNLSDDRRVLYIIVCAVAIALVVFCILLVFAIVRPLDRLASQMELVAELKLDDIKQELSQLSEVTRLQKSFWQMVRFLREWKAFVPTDALLGGVDDDATVVGSSFPMDSIGATTDPGEDGAAIPKPDSDGVMTQNSEDQGGTRKTINVSMPTQPAAARGGESGRGVRFAKEVRTPRSPDTQPNSPRRAKPASAGRSLMSRLQDTGTLRYRRGSLMLAETYASLHCDAKSFEHAQGAYTASKELSGRMTVLVNPVLDATTRSGGTLVLITAERCYVSWNIFKSCHDYATTACRSALDMASRVSDAVQQSGLEQKDRWWSFCLSGGGSFIGNVGNDGRRAPIVVSSCIALIQALSRLAPRLGSRVLVSDKLYRAVPSSTMDARAVDVVPDNPVPDVTGCSRGTTKVYELMQADPLSPRSRKIYAVAFSEMCQGLYEKAGQGLTQILKDHQDHHSLRLLRISLHFKAPATGNPPQYSRAWRLPWEDHESASATVELPRELRNSTNSHPVPNDSWAAGSLRSRRRPSMSEAQALEQQIVQATRAPMRTMTARRLGSRHKSSNKSSRVSGSKLPHVSSGEGPPGTPLGIAQVDSVQRSPGGSHSPLDNDTDSTNSSELHRRRGGGLRPGRPAVQSPTDPSSTDAANSIGSSANGRAPLRRKASPARSSSGGSGSPPCGSLRPGRSPPAIDRSRSPGSTESGTTTPSSSACGSPLSPEMSHNDGTGAGAAVAKEFTTGRGDRRETWYRGERCLGRGAFGEVWLAMGDAGQLVALKALPLPAPTKRRHNKGLRAVNAGMNQDELHALVYEVELMTKLRHENIVWYLGSGVVNRCIVIVMEYLPGGSLMGLLGEFGAIKLGPARRYITDMLDGLFFLHQEGIVHRDLKPANVLLTIEGQCKLADFGASGELASKSKTGGIAGTPLYMAPEAVRQAGLKPSDMWSLGITIIQLLTGKLPYDIPADGFNAMGFMRRLERGDVVPTVPLTLAPGAGALVRACLQHSADARPTAEQLLQHEFLVSSP
eukprot:TRINITY_DN735_c0_g1_i1.p1 TRINITY_DN735_c0_g1~~TRINITY_DN735_c0_g1_i1.p1  ORF type:complete len:1588 (+),score=349.99 TRINITY_DN735_c0_g1_i1:161-4924(+)